MSEVWRGLRQRFVRLLPPLTESFLLVALPVQNYFIISVIYTFFFFFRLTNTLHESQKQNPNINKISQVWAYGDDY